MPRARTSPKRHVPAAPAAPELRVREVHLGGVGVSDLLAGPVGDADWTKRTLQWGSDRLDARFKLAREHTRQSPIPLVGTVLRLKQSLFDHGARLTAVKPEDDTAVQGWLRDEGGEAVFAGLRDDVWSEWLALDNALVAWAVYSSRPYTLAPEACDYRNRGSLEVLRWRHGFEEKERKEMAKAFTAPADRAAWLERHKSEIIRVGDPEWNRAHPNLADQFRVLTRERWGFGLGSPGVLGLLQACDQYWSLALGEAALGYLARRATRQHKAGYAITAGPNAGTTNTHARETWPATVKKKWNGKTGPAENATNFDIEEVINWVDPKFFTADKWKSVAVRACEWAGPLGYILLAPQAATDWWSLLLAEAHAERGRVGRLLAAVLGEFAGVPVRVEWSDECLLNQRIFFEALKQAHAAGPLSSKTFLAKLGISLADETARKRAELALEKEEPGLLKPLYDAAHGNNGADAGGRPPGAPDPTPA